MFGHIHLLCDKDPWTVYGDQQWTCICFKNVDWIFNRHGHTFHPEVQKPSSVRKTDDGIFHVHFSVHVIFHHSCPWTRGIGYRPFNAAVLFQGNIHPQCSHTLSTHQKDEGENVHEFSVYLVMLFGPVV